VTTLSQVSVAIPYTQNCGREGDGDDLRMAATGDTKPNLTEPNQTKPNLT